MKITVIEAGARYRVESDSGKTYAVRYCGSGDGDPDVVGLWECDCPAGQHGRDCKHLNAILLINAALDEAGCVDWPGGISEIEVGKKTGSDDLIAIFEAAGAAQEV